MNLTNAVAETKVAEKVYYVIVRKWGHRYLGADAYPGPWTKTPQEALKFSSVADALQHVRKGNQQDGDGITRITEVPGSRTVRTVSTTQINTLKPVVLFDTRSGYSTGVQAPPSTDIQKATVFSNVNDLLTTIQREIQELGDSVRVNENFRVHQVEVVTSAPTITETILA